jgi:hypothetical protein
MKHLLIVMIFFTASCSMRTFYPTLGGITGGAAGAVAGGPATAAAGAGVGVMAGELAKGNEDLRQAKQTITALSKGDVEGLIAAGMGEQKGFLDEALDAVYGFIKLCLVLLILWNLVPIIYTRYIHKKHTNGIPEKT